MPTSRMRPFLALMTLILAAAAFALQRGTNERRPNTSTAHERTSTRTSPPNPTKNLRDWPPLPTPERPVRRARPAIPELPPLPLDPPDNWVELLGDRVWFLLQHHPNMDVRKEMMDALGSGDLILNFQANLWGNKAMFIPSTPEQMQRIPETWALDERGFYKVMHLHVPYVASVESEEDILKFWLTLEHEFTHYRQFLGESAESILAYTGKTPRAIRLGCERRWNTEREAYRNQCLQAEAWGIKPFGNHPICSGVLSDEVFDQHLFNTLMKANPRPVCQRVMAELSGHPHPEAFGG